MQTMLSKAKAIGPKGAMDCESQIRDPGRAAKARPDAQRKEERMIRNLKALGLALAAVFAMSAVAASSASAVDHFTTPEGVATILTGTSENNVFKITSPAVEFKCKTSRFKATVVSQPTVATVKPIYEGTPGATDTGHCFATVVEKVTVDMNGCDYDLSGETTGKDLEKVDATVSITCPVGKEIELTSPLCNTFVHEQTPTEGGVTYDNEKELNGKKDVKVTVTATGVTWKAEDSFACTLGGLKEGSNADYTGNVTITGFKEIGKEEEGEQVDIEVS